MAGSGVRGWLGSGVRGWLGSRVRGWLRSRVRGSLGSGVRGSLVYHDRYSRDASCWNSFTVHINSGQHLA